jgi:hypothetical protein
LATGEAAEFSAFPVPYPSRTFTIEILSAVADAWSFSIERSAKTPFTLQLFNFAPKQDSSMRHIFVYFVVSAVALSVVAGFLLPQLLWTWILLGPIIVVGIHDYFQVEKSIPRNFPAVGRMRYLLEFVRPEIYQYFVEGDTEGVPFDRDQRSLVYQRAKKVRDTIPFGTKQDLYVAGYEWINHSMVPIHHKPEDMRITIGGPDCKHPYSASLLNISAMSFGSLSKNAVLALSTGAKLGKPLSF